MKRFAGAAVIAIALAGLTGCSGVETKANDNGLDERTITLSDGRVLTCVARTASYKGGLSCDWAGASIPLPLPLGIAVVALANLVACFAWARHTTRKKGKK